MRGRKPKPTKVKELQGNPGKRPLNVNEPAFSDDAPVCPGWLDAIAKTKWNRIIPELRRLGLLKSVDGDILATYCQAWAEFQIATKDVQKNGRILETATGYRYSNPAVLQQNRAQEIVRKLGSLFGFDPSSRSRMNKSDSEEGDEFEQFLKNNGREIPPTE